MSDKDRRGEPSPDFGDWNAALDAVDRRANAQTPVREPIDQAELNRQISEIMKAALAASEPLAPPDAVPGVARKRRLTWVLLGGIWIAMAAIAWAAFGAILRSLR
jgi:hypothetical protein